MSSIKAKCSSLLLALLPTMALGLGIHCPGIEQIKTGHFSGWLAVYINGEALAFPQDRERFILEVKDFSMAAWSSDFLENAHCFYKGKDPVFGEITLVHDAFRPESNALWQWIFPEKLAECRSPNVLDCYFLL